MKRIATILIINALFHLFSYGQVEIDAGENILLCNFDPFHDSICLGGNPTVISGEYVKLYWEAKYNYGNHIYCASNYINDTLGLNPKFIDTPVSGDSICFYLYVEDLSGNVYVDSVVVKASSYICLDEYGLEYMNENDTIQIYSFCESLNEPYSFAWYPNYNISDTTINNPLIWPENDTIYVLTITDNLGCSYYIEYEIYVSPASISNVERLKGIIIYPLPGNENTVIQFTNYMDNEKIIEFFNLEGKRIIYLKTNENEIKLSKLNISSGYYICKITVDNNIKYSGKIIYAP